MQFGLTEEQRAVKLAARRLAQEQFAPHAVDFYSKNNKTIK